jgi:hypothetical protein
MRALKIVAIAFAMLMGAGAFSAARADGCYLCASGSSCDQCRYGANDTQEARKACEARGCKVQGTTTCSGAANIKYCRVERVPPAVALVCAHYLAGN